VADDSDFKIQIHVQSKTVAQVPETDMYRFEATVVAFSEKDQILKDLGEYLADRWVFPYGDLASDVRATLEQRLEEKEREINRLKMELDRLRREGDEARNFFEELGKGLKTGRIGT